MASKALCICLAVGTNLWLIRPHCDIVGPARRSLRTKAAFVTFGSRSHSTIGCCDEYSAPSQGLHSVPAPSCQAPYEKL
ncbi:hypothetical protein chiPu_0020149 [Chiloscyllium punctatum]|uniref:Secreted protein n=1 Tax=Chiloscyllium punctatum TaxID=137246 RepID=A0A401RU51_CHIPU|nr:hypothetical protein [Chiloscyllium punctatum]